MSLATLQKKISTFPEEYFDEIDSKGNGNTPKTLTLLTMKLQRILRNTYENSSGHAHSRLVSYPRRSIIAKGLGYSARPRQRNFLQFRKHLGNPDEIFEACRRHQFLW